jgi:hypothetical protein
MRLMGGRSRSELCGLRRLYVVAAVDAEHVLELAAAEDEDSVEAISAESADPALGVSVRVRRLDRGSDHLDAL